jgi:HKD family nuclease
MEVEFIAANPQERAITLLDELLEQGMDQVCIACAFLTAGGAKFLERHADRLKLPESFLVVSWGQITDDQALEKLHCLAPGNVYYHLGSQSPYETRVGPGLMHSKVFFARAGNKCWLWTGSHNLTASALQGVNREAAILLTGTMDEHPFQDALRHLHQCRNEAKVFDPANPPPNLRAEQTLVVHAEAELDLKPLPWHVHLRPSSTAYDMEMRPPGAVWLYLHKKGVLDRYQPVPVADAVYSGTLTALNFTEHHPKRGIPADWDGADYVIEQHGGIFRLVEQEMTHARTPSQAVIRIDSIEEPTTIWVSEDPRPQRERIVSSARLVEVDPEFLKFFNKGSVKDGKLVFRDYRDMSDVARLQRNEVGNVTNDELLSRMSYAVTPLLEVAKNEVSNKRSPFIRRAKYRL